MMIKRSALEHVRPVVLDPNARTASESLNGFDFDPDPEGGYLYVTARALTSDVPNLNQDMFPHEEMKTAYESFVGCPVYVEHHNTDLDRARGVILDAKYHDDGDDKWTEILMEMDEETFPKLCSMIRSGELDTMSMGCQIEGSTCSVCGNYAEDAGQFCDHIAHKTSDPSVYEICAGIEFIEESWVYTPADPTAMTTAKTATKTADDGWEWYGDNLYIRNYDDGASGVVNSDGYGFTFTLDDEWGQGIADSWGSPADSAEDAMSLCDDAHGGRTATRKTAYAEKDENVFEWYRRNYPSDDLGMEIRADITFSDVWRALNDGIGGNFYYWVGVGDSLVRERIFQGVSDAYSKDYSIAYYLWLYGDDYRNGLISKHEFLSLVQDACGFSIVSKLGKYASRTAQDVHVPDAPDPNGNAGCCPVCDNPGFDGSVCDVCGYTEYPEGFGPIDTDEGTVDMNGEGEEPDEQEDETELDDEPQPEDDAADEQFGEDDGGEDEDDEQSEEDEEDDSDEDDGEDDDLPWDDDEQDKKEGRMRRIRKSELRKRGAAADMFEVGDVIFDGDCFYLIKAIDVEWLIVAEFRMVDSWQEVPPEEVEWLATNLNRYTSGTVYTYD